MVDIYASVNSFRNFETNVLLWKNKLKTRKRLLSDDHTGDQGLVQRFLPFKSYEICKKLYPAKFLCNWEMLESAYIHLKKAKNYIYISAYKMVHTRIYMYIDTHIAFYL